MEMNLSNTLHYFERWISELHIVYQDKWKITLVLRDKSELSLENITIKGCILSARSRMKKHLKKKSPFHTSKSEKRTAKEYGGYRQVGSGRLDYAGSKGDVRVPGKYLIEQKDPTTNKHVVKITSLEDVFKNALSGEIPLYLIKYPPYSLFILPIDDLLEMNDDFTVIETYTIKRTKTLNIHDVYMYLISHELACIKLKSDKREYAIITKQDFDKTEGKD